MIDGCARVSTDRRSVDAQVAQFCAAGIGKVLQEIAGGAKSDRAGLCRASAALDAGDVPVEKRIDRLAARHSIFFKPCVRSPNAVLASNP